MDWLKNLPYILLIIANFTYLYFYGFKPLQYHPKLILYNFLIFLLIGVILFFKVSYHLYQWFVKGEEDTRQKTKEKIAEGLRVVEMVGNYFRPGNLHNLVYVGISLYSFTRFWHYGPFFRIWFLRFCLGFSLDCCMKPSTKSRKNIQKKLSNTSNASLLWFKLLKILYQDTNSQA